MRIDNSSVRAKSSAILCLLALIVLAPSVPSLRGQDLRATASIQGVVTECWEGKRRPVPDVRVFVIDTSENPDILARLEKLEQIHVRTTEDMQEFFQAFDEIVVPLKRLDKDAPPARTDKKGQFAKHKLASARKYLIIAIDWDRGDADEDPYFRAIRIGPLKRSRVAVNIYMGPGTSSNCHQ